MASIAALGRPCRTVTERYGHQRRVQVAQVVRWRSWRYTRDIIGEYHDDILVGDFKHVFHNIFGIILPIDFPIDFHIIIDEYWVYSWDIYLGI